MRARIVIEYDIPNGDRIALRDREEQRWVRSETRRAVPSATIEFEWVDDAKASEFGVAGWPRTKTREGKSTG